MNDFEFDVMERKRIARSAKYRKYGSKSKKCAMSTDHMSNKEWKERCGEVVTYPMNKPMRWNDFKRMPLDLQHEYIFTLIEKYNVNYTALAEMFGVISMTVSNYFKTNGFGVSFSCGNRMNAVERDAWHQFLYKEDNMDDATVESEDAHPDGCDDVITDICDNTTVNYDNGMRMSKFSLQFSGKIDITAISNSLYRILGENSVGEIDIEFTQKAP